MTSKAVTLFALTAFSHAQGVTQAIRPKSTAAPWCLQTIPGQFGIAVQPMGGIAARDVEKINHVLPVMVNELGDGQPQIHQRGLAALASISTHTVSFWPYSTLREALC